MSLADGREQYDGTDPSAVVLRGHVEEYTENFSSWETDLFDIARTTGMDGNMVGALRDEAITLGELVAERGVPATQEELDLVFKRANVPPASRKALTASWLRAEGKVG